MRKIGLLSDTHCFIDERVLDFFKDCDEIWHAGDIGNEETADKLEKYKPFRAVHGNIDDHNLRIRYKQFEIFTCEEMKILMTHIGGYPGHYEKGVTYLLEKEKPNVFICGHSHILRVINDKKYNVLCINPGAAGNSGFHAIKTVVRFEIESSRIQNLEVLEMKRNK